MSTLKRPKQGGIPSQSKKMKVTGTVEMSTASAITEVPSELEPRRQTDYQETKTMYK